MTSTKHNTGTAYPTHAELVARLRAAGPPPNFDHLDDPDLTRRLIGDDVPVLDSGDDAEPVKRDSGDDAQPVKPVKRRKRRLDFVKETKRAIAAGLPVRSTSVTPDGFVMTFDQADAAAADDVIETEDELRKLI